MIAASYLVFGKKGVSGRAAFNLCSHYLWLSIPVGRPHVFPLLGEEDMQCPVCDGSARDHTPPEFHGIVVRCATCGNFDIANEYLDKLRALEPAARREVLRKAKQLAKLASPSINRWCF